MTGQPRPLPTADGRDGPPPLPGTADARPAHCDVLVVGGGINGAGIARDLAGRGWRVVLAEQDDLAAHTSSASTKLVHGGLRYLEHGEFGLVRKSLVERETLLRAAPHLARPLRFVLPHDRSMRPAWMIRAGLLLYDHLARRELLPGSEAVDLARHPAGAALRPGLVRGFAFSDGWVDDARLVTLCAVDAQARGATVLTRTRVGHAQRGPASWQVRLDTPGGARKLVARALVNATGPWAADFLREVARPAAGEALATRRLRLVQGSHVVVPRREPHEFAYLFQNPDGRVLFALPYEQRFTLLGTTEVERGDDPRAVGIAAAEIDYLCTQANRYLRRPHSAAEVVWTFSGVRPLLDDGAGNAAAVTRDYLLEARDDGAPLLTVWGGKLTTFRRLAEEVADRVGRQLGERRPAWTATAVVPGGELAGWIGPLRRPDTDFERFVAAARARYPWIDAALLLRLARAYGTRLDLVLGDARGPGDLGRALAPGLHERELAYLRAHEWATTADDALWRRSKLGLVLDPAAAGRVAAWFAGQPAELPTPCPATAGGA